ncbi:IclR family transcriptional regulator [Phenylobacterium montanum]|uniref:IclR family transcriptional regulator n=1 Tax=Phenylobacterium montanum TaxID=2823693 RepID=A0A975IYA7_9CAUL|nr:IclR family transcriptional regulator C-terminal domain-containing protein [Caulobacter sp. S6]QUD90256.1 IclR family transcriptional regulator [Caulobacter sp. S6]
MLAVLGLFSIERPVWTAEEAADVLSVSLSSAYRYFALLGEAGLVTTIATGRYTLGPSISQWDRQIQLTDPLLTAARPVMQDLVGYAPPGSAVLLCRYFGDRVLCVFNVFSEGPQSLVSYERGRPMPLFRGATSKAILANLPHRALRRLQEEHAGEIAAAGLGEDWPTFRTNLAALRKAGAVVTRQEVDRDRVGIAAPILKDDRHALGSLSFVVRDSTTDASQIRRLSAIVIAAAGDIEAALRNPEQAQSPAAARA